jgi:BASS family bile acid:Na+ symporter
METAEALMGMIFNTALVVMIVATMFGAGLSTTLSALGGVFKNVKLLLLVLLAALIVRPLIGWVTAAGLSLATPAFIAMLLLASCPGAPFGAKLVMTSRGDVVTGASLQVVLAAIGSVTFPITASLLIGAASLGDNISIPVLDLIRTVAILQLVPFAAGVAVRHWSSETAAKWNPTATQISSYTLLIVLALAVLGSWSTIVALLGSRTLLAGIIFAVVMLIVGYFLAVGNKVTRTSAALIQPCSNTGPVMAAVAIAFNNDPAILSAVVAINLLQIIVGVFAASYIAKGRPETGDTLAEGQAAAA